jgi:hypothetical protein
MLHDTDFMVIRGILGNTVSDSELERYLSPRGREIAAALRATDPFRRTLLLTQLLYGVIKNPYGHNNVWLSSQEDEAPHEQPAG